MKTRIIAFTLLPCIWTCGLRGEPIEIESIAFRLVIGKGGIQSLKRAGSDVELILPGSELYALRFKGGDELSSTSASKVTVGENGKDGTTVLKFAHAKGAAVRITITSDRKSPFATFRMAFRSAEPKRIDYLSFPVLKIPRRLSGPQPTFISSQANGLLVENPARRFVAGGFYPGPASMQLTGCYAAEGGVYLAAHDVEGHVKQIIADGKNGASGNTAAGRRSPTRSPSAHFREAGRRRRNCTVRGRRRKPSGANGNGRIDPRRRSG